MKTVRFFTLCLTLATAAHARIIYVDDDANAPGDGRSWQTAYKYLQDALADANAAPKPVEIRVAQGTYRPDQDVLHPDGTGDREASFQLISGVTIKGGYAGLVAVDPNARDIGMYGTILSGDLGGNDVDEDSEWDYWEQIEEPSRAENSYHVVTCDAVDATSILDGITITSGNANERWLSIWNNSGAGIFNSAGTPKLLNCTLSGNWAYAFGGGMYNVNGNPTLDQCTFVANRCWGFGGGMCNHDSSPNLTDCTFSKNSAEDPWDTGGGGMCNLRSHPVLIRCSFDRNWADAVQWELYGDGGAILNIESNPTLTACTFSNNSAQASGAVGCYYSSPVLTNCMFTGNSSLTDGGGLRAILSSATLINCTFHGNTAATGGGLGLAGSDSLLVGCSFARNSAFYGGGMNSCGEWGRPPSSPSLIQCVFAGNTALRIPGYGGYGGGLANAISSPVLSNCTFTGNRADEAGAGVHSRLGSVPEFTNCILWNNLPQEIQGDGAAPLVAYSDIRGGHEGEGNIDADPCFVAPGFWTLGDDDDVWIAGDYHLKSQAGRYDPATQSWVIDDVTSPCIDAGDPMTPIGLEPFPNGGRVNMGAYGGTGEASKSWFGGPVCETIVAGDINGDCKVDLADFALLSLHWLDDPR